jgi:hypothetical protein
LKKKVRLASINIQAYHDMATHDIESGTGGLDASIAFELDRPQVSYSNVASTQDIDENDRTSELECLNH